jgi:hypothetical protein
MERFIENEVVDGQIFYGIIYKIPKNLGLSDYGLDYLKYKPYVFSSYTIYSKMKDLIDRLSLRIIGNGIDIMIKNLKVYESWQNDWYPAKLFGLPPDFLIFEESIYVTEEILLQSRLEERQPICIKLDISSMLKIP